jgi:ribosomal protein S18 acetylase RimI-like enzyme
VSGEIDCRDITLGEVRAIPQIVSSYETDRVYRLEAGRGAQSMSWRLVEERLARPFRKRYDSGRVEDWLESYLEWAPLETLRFMSASVDEHVAGLLTWQKVGWNNTLWLMDIRTRKDARRSGVGTALVERLKTQAGRQGTRGIFVETQISNYPAIRFYRRHAFVISGFNTHLYTNADLEKQDVALYLFWERR